MAKLMQQASLELVDKNTPGAQKVAILNKPYDVSIKYARIPEPNENQVLVKIKWVGICGSDLEAYRGTRAPEFMSTPARIGHEVGGVIDKIGSNVTGLKEGDTVTCRYIWGAFAQYIVCSPFNVKVLPKGFPLDETSPIEVLPGILHAAELGNINSAKNVLIMGQGVSGLIMTQVISLYSPKNLAVTDLYDCKLELAMKYGATHTYKLAGREDSNWEAVCADFPQGFDVVIPCLLEGDGMVDAIDCVSLCGKIVAYGCIGVCNKPIDFFKAHRKRLEIYMTEPRRDVDNRKFFQESIQWVLDGLVNTREFVTHRFKLDEIDEAFRVRDQGGPGVIHVLVDCEGE